MEPRWLTEALVKRLNADLVAEHGGVMAVRDRNLLGSAVARPQNQFHYGSPPPSVFALAAAYGFGIARNHPFADGNKRTALLAMYVFLEDNDYGFGATEADAAAMIEELAAGKVGEEGLAQWLQDVCTRKQR